MKRTDTTQRFSDRMSELIRLKRKDGVKISDIASSSGVPTGSISQYQREDAEAGINSLEKLAKYFKVSTDYILGLTDNPDLQKNTGLSPAAATAITDGLTRDQINALNSMLSSREGLHVLSNIGFFLSHNLVGWSPINIVHDEFDPDTIRVVEKNSGTIFGIKPDFLQNMFLIEIQGLLVELKKFQECHQTPL